MTTNTVNLDKYILLQDDDGFVPFNYYRELGQNQYASRYAHGRIEGYPNLGEGLRWKNHTSGNYLKLAIHIDDLAEFHNRVTTYLNRNPDYETRKDWEYDRDMFAIMDRIYDDYYNGGA